MKQRKRERERESALIAWKDRHRHWNERNGEKGRMKNHSDGDTLITKATYRYTSISKTPTTFYEIHSTAKIFSCFSSLFFIIMLWPFAITELMTVLVGCFLSFTIPTSPSPSLHGRNSNRFLYTTTEYVMAFCTPVPSHILAHSVVWLRNQFKCKSVYGFIYASADNNANPFYMACLKIHISMFEIRKIEGEREREWASA